MFFYILYLSFTETYQQRSRNRFLLIMILYFICEILFNQGGSVVDATTCVITDLYMSTNYLISLISSSVFYLTLCDDPL